MQWLTSLLTDTHSIAHVLFVFTFLISLGMMLGKLQIYGISFGVTCVLFVSLIANSLGVTVDPTVLDFTRNFGLMLFVFLIGLEVGPSFFSSFKNEGLQLNIMMLVMVALSIIVTLALFFIFSDTVSLPQILGVHYGAITCTAGLGATQEVLTGLNYQGEDIAVGYACAYPLSILGVIGSMIFVKMIFRINSEEEERKLNEAECASNSEPVEFLVSVTNVALDKKDLKEVNRILGRTFVCSRIIRGKELISPMGRTVITLGDKLKIVAEPTDKDLLIALFGKEEYEAEQPAETTSPVHSAIIRVTKEQVNGLLIGQLHLSQLEGLNVSHIYRSGLKLFPHNNLRLQLGDALHCIGPDESIQRLESRLGNKIQKLDRPNIVTLFFGMLLGIFLGSLPIAVPGMPIPLKLGLAGGSLLIGVLIGRYGPSLKLVTYTTHSANLMMRETGLALFLASVGLTAGENFAHALVSGNGWIYVVFGLLITMLPCMIGGVIARIKYKMNFHLIMGLMSGATTNAPTLAYAESQSEKNTAVIAYSTVYPLATFVRIMTGQVILALMWMYI